MTNNAPRHHVGELDDEGRQPDVVDLAVLDPGFRDRGYWARFRYHVMERAASELGRRRERTEITVLELAHSWSRVLVPAATLAAALGALLLSQGRQVGSLTAVGPEEVLTQTLEDRTLADFMDTAEADEGAFLLVEGTF